MSPLEDIRLRILKDTGESDDLTTNDQKMHCRLSGNDGCDSPSPCSSTTDNNALKKRRPVSAQMLKHNLESGKWRKRPLKGSSLRFQYFDELVEGEKQLNLMTCRLCESTFSMFSRSHCLDHIKSKHPEVLMDGGVKLPNTHFESMEQNNSLDDNDVKCLSLNRIFKTMNDAGEVVDNRKWLHRSFNFCDSGFSTLSPEETNFSAENFSSSPAAKRRRLITSEMAKIRVESGEWQIRDVPGTSVRCRFFYELMEGDKPLNILSCKMCNATYSTQSRSHYREHVRRLHSEVYSVRAGKLNEFGHSNNSYGDDISSDSPVVDSPSPLLIGGLSEENGSITTTTQNNEFADNLYESGPSLYNISAPPTTKVRRVVTTEMALSRIEAGEWCRMPIAGVSIRSKFFEDIFEFDGDRLVPMNTLICKLCDGTYSTQSRSHIVEHVKKRHMLFLNCDDDTFESEVQYSREAREAKRSAAKEQQKTESIAGNQRRKRPASDQYPEAASSPSLHTILKNLASQVLMQDQEFFNCDDDDTVLSSYRLSDVLQSANDLEPPSNNEIDENFGNAENSRAVNELGIERCGRSGDFKAGIILMSSTLSTKTAQPSSSHPLSDTDIHQLDTSNRPTQNTALLDIGQGDEDEDDPCSSFTVMPVQQPPPTLRRVGRSLRQITRDLHNRNQRQSSTTLMKDSASPPHLVDERQHREKTDRVDDNSFCGSCKAEIPNIVRSLNQLYERVDDLVNIMHLALGDAHVKNPNDKNVAEANRRLQLYNKSNVAQKELNDQEIVCADSDDGFIVLEDSDDDKSNENQSVEGGKQLEYDVNKSRSTTPKMQSDGDNCSRRVQENGSSIREENKIAELSADDGEEAINSDNVDVQTALDKIFISSQTVDRPEGDNERRNVCKSPPSQQLAAAVRDVYLPFLEKEILRVVPLEFTLAEINEFSSVIRQARLKKVKNALSHLVSRKLLEITDTVGSRFRKNIDEVAQLNICP